MAGRPTRYACSVGLCLEKLSVSRVTNEWSVDVQCMSEYVWRTVGKTVPPTTSCPLHYLSSTLPWMELSIAKVRYSGIKVHTDTITLIIRFVAFSTLAVFTCRRFNSAFLAPFWCRRYDLSPFWPWTNRFHFGGFDSIGVIPCQINQFCKSSPGHSLSQILFVFGPCIPQY